MAQIIVMITRTDHVMLLDSANRFKFVPCRCCGSSVNKQFDSFIQFSWDNNGSITFSP